jgi:predicted transposase YbfD/YdcC
MKERDVYDLETLFAEVEDPRVERTKLHRLRDILILAICGVICEADGWVEIEEFGKAKEAWFTDLLALPNGIPSHDTFGRVFGLLDPKQFEASFLHWVEGLAQTVKGVIAIDGKSLRRSHDQAAGKKALHLVSAWAAENRLVLAQLATEEKSNEITAIPLLLQQLALAGCIVTIEAMGTQTKIAEQIIEQEGAYALALKDNQRNLYNEVKATFALAEQDAFVNVQAETHRDVEKGHGRLEMREYWTIRDAEILDYLDPDQQWKGLRAIGMVRAERRIEQEVSRETRYFLLSFSSVDTFAYAVRSHWGIENQLHWEPCSGNRYLDVAFREDESRVRQGHADENLALLRHISLNLLRQETSSHVGIHAKRLKAGWNNDYLLQILDGVNLQIEERAFDATGNGSISLLELLGWSALSQHLLHSVNDPMLYRQLNEWQWARRWPGKHVSGGCIKETIMARAIQLFALLLVGDCTGEMRTHIAIGHQSFSRQIDQDSLGILIWKCEDFPLVLAQFPDSRDRHGLDLFAFRQITYDGEDSCCQEQRPGTGQQEAQRVAPRHDLILTPGIGKFCTPFLENCRASWNGFAVVNRSPNLMFHFLVWIHRLFHEEPPRSARSSRVSLASLLAIAIEDTGTAAGSGSRGVQGCGGAARSGIPAVAASAHRPALRVAVACGTSLPLPKVAPSTSDMISRASSSSVMMT